MIYDGFFIMAKQGWRFLGSSVISEAFFFFFFFF